MSPRRRSGGARRRSTRRVAAFVKRHDDEVSVTSDPARRHARDAAAATLMLREGDMLILGGEPDALERVIAADRLDARRPGPRRARGSQGEEIGVIEAVIGTRLAADRADRRPAAAARALRHQPDRGVAQRRAADAAARRHRAARGRRDRAAGAADAAARAAARTRLRCRSPSARCGWAMRARGCCRWRSWRWRCWRRRRGYVPVAVAFFAAAALIVVERRAAGARGL